MKTTIALKSHTLTVSHEACSSFGTPADDVLLLTVDRDVPNTLSRIEVTSETLHNIVYVHWNRSESITEDFDLLLEEETQTLFIGAGRMSASIDLLNCEVVQKNEVFLFWEFKQIGDWILELGELDCFLYDRRGNQIAQAPVDPPYEYYITDDGVRLESPVYGTQWLRYPQ